jgi:hypothetical protein
MAVLTTMPTECTTWPFSTTRAAGGLGYPTITINGRSRPVHQLVCEWYHGPRPKGLEVCHSCSNGLHGCFAPAHLRWDTRAANTLDRKRKDEDDNSHDARLHR